MFANVWFASYLKGVQVKVKELITMLAELDMNAVIDIAQDEEGNAFGDIATGVSEGKLKRTGEKVYSIYPSSSEMPEERYI